MNRTVCVVGLGYIGLPTASILGTKGYSVRGVDASPHVVETINRGEIHFFEPDLDILVKSAVQSGNLTAKSTPEAADVFIIAVPTPLSDSDKTPDLSYVESATRSIAPVIRARNLVLIFFLNAAATTETVVLPILRELNPEAAAQIHLAHCPERVLPGRILAELVDNDRIVGGIDEASSAVAAAFYEEFVGGAVYRTDAATAEMAKLAENTFRDVNIALANELSVVCERHGIDAWDMIGLANRHPRVNILQPGPGVGGHCIAVDPWFIVAAAEGDARLIRTAREGNDGKTDWVIGKVQEAASRFRAPVIGCLGLAFKADVDDLRSSPALEIVRRLRRDRTGEILICEPNLKGSDEFELLPVDQVIARSDIVVLLVDHKEFKSIRRVDLLDKVVLDTRGVIR